MTSSASDPLRKQTSISVIIPTYRAADFVTRAVASVLAQEGIETPQVILVDDASGDATGAVIADLAAHHETVEAYSNPQNLGPAGTRNRAIERATGDWIAVLDADDAYAQGRLARLIAVADAENLDAIADLPVFWDLAADCAAPDQLPQSGVVTRPSMVDFLRLDPETGLDLGLLKPVFRRRLVQTGLWQYPENIRHGEDSALYLTLVQAGVRFGLLHEAHYKFSTRVGAVSGTYSPGSVTDVDYLAVIAQTETLRAHLAATGALTAELASVLDARRAYLLGLNRAYGWTCLRKGDWRRLRRWLAQGSGNAKALADVAWAKLRGHRGKVE